MRARDALAYFKNTSSQFTSVELINHKKEIGTNPDISTATVEETGKKKPMIKEKNIIDDEGFTVIKKGK